MTDKQLPTQVLTEEQAARIGGGGECSASDVVGILGQLTSAYESLVDFTSHVIERVVR